MSTYKTAPAPTKEMPKGIPYIIANEAAERFSYYGMRAILVIFMTKYLVDSSGFKDVMSPADARAWYHFFSSAVYFMPVFGAILSDYILGKYRTILSLSIVYCAGHLALALDETRFGLALGLTLIAIGSGGIKPCVSAHVGDQFGKSNHHLLEKVFGWFYFSINLGSFASTLLTPFLLAKYGPHVAFGLPGALMLTATWFFWMGRNEFIHIPPGGGAFLKEVFGKEGLKTFAKLALIYVFIAMFWALFDQTGSAWVLQAERMDRHWLGITWYSSQIHAINPLLIMLFIPLFTFVVYPALDKVFPLTPLRKISIGLFVAVPAFLIPAWIEGQLAQGIHTSIVWQLLAYAIITAAEVFVSITCLEFSYTQAPKKMKSFIMAFYLMSISLGNIFVAVVNMVIQEQKTVSAKVSASLDVDTKKTTTYALTCKGKKGATLSRKIRVAVEVPIKKKKKAEKKDDKSKKKDLSPRIAVWKANGKAGHLFVRPKVPVTLSWHAKNLETCTLNPGKRSVATKGSLVVKPEKTTTTYTLVCQTETKKKTVGAKLKVHLRDFSIDAFAVMGQKKKLSIPPPGKQLKIAWKTTNAASCKLVAHTSKLSNAGYYYFFSGAMFLTAILFIFVAYFYKEQTYIQDEDDAEPQASEPSDDGEQGSPRA